MRAYFKHRANEILKLAYDSGVLVPRGAGPEAFEDSRLLRAASMILGEEFQDVDLRLINDPPFVKAVHRAG